MPSFSQMTQVNSTDPFNGGLGARKPRPEEIAKQQTESAVKEAAEQRTYSFEKVVHATEKQMRSEVLKPPQAPTAKLDAHGYFTHNYLLQATAAETQMEEIEGWWKTASPAAVEQKPKADRIWPNDFRREIKGGGCDLLGVFNDHFGINAKAGTIASLARRDKVTPREYLAGLTHLKTEDDKVWFTLPNGRSAYLHKTPTN